MDDMTLCLNNECQSREQCYRYKAKPNPVRQSYAIYEPDGNGKCQHFIAFCPRSEECTSR